MSADMHKGIFMMKFNIFEMKTLVRPLAILTALSCIVVNSCISVTGVSDSQRQQLVSNGFSVAILDVHSGTPNSAGGVNAYINWQNISDKEIKYIAFTVTPYNRVNDIVRSEIGGKTTATLQDTGPFKVNQIVSGSYWENVWYNSTIDHIVLTGIQVTFMDGSLVTYDPIQVNQMSINSRGKSDNSSPITLGRDPSNVLIGTWLGSAGLGDIRFEGNQFVMASTGPGGSVNSYIGTFSYDVSSQVLVLNVTGGILSEKWLGKHTGKAVVDGDTLKCSEFVGDGAVAFNFFPFTKKK